MCGKEPQESDEMNISRILTAQPTAILRRFASPAGTERVRREWWAYFGAFGDDFFGDDD